MLNLSLRPEFSQSLFSSVLIRVHPWLKCGFSMAFVALCASSFAQDPFAENIRKTDPLTPEQERLAFHVPAGFEVQLVACEPDIGKPMNLAWDASGRLWLTQSREYPFAAPVDKPGRDMIKVLSNFSETGRAQK